MENTPETKTATIEVNQEPVKKFIFKKIDPKILYVILIAFLFLTGGAIYMVRQNAKLDLTKSINGSSASLVNKTTNKSQTTLNNDN